MGAAFLCAISARGRAAQRAQRQHHQLLVPDDRRPAASHAGAADARGRGATPAVWGVILQFPFYAGIAAIITTTHLNERLANAFVSISSPSAFPRWLRSIQRCWACSCRLVDRNG
jgi:hypothetical protein